MGAPEIPDLDKLMTAVEKRLPYGERIVQGMLIVVVMAIIAFCVGLVAQVIAQLAAQVAGASAKIPTFGPTVWQVLAFVIVVTLAGLLSWRATSVVKRMRAAVAAATAEAQEAKKLLVDLNEQRVRAKDEGDRLTTLLADHPKSSTFVSTAKPKPTTAMERERIADGEFDVSPLQKNGGLYIRVGNWKSVNKVGYEICVVRMLWYSPDLEGKGGFLDWPWFVNAPHPKCLPRQTTAKQRELIHGFPQLFDLLPPPTSDGWRFNLSSGNATYLKKPRWRFVLELQWDGRHHPLLADVTLKNENGERVADLLLSQGDEALALAASG